tara:strand:+ start:433 stop:1647 length:1215 start_codon:yes stop_codon:yes gene_type:complete
LEKIKNIIFISLINIKSNISERGLYNDLLREFRNNHHNLTVVSPLERRERKPTEFFVEDGVNYIKIKTLNIQKTNFIEKGIGTILIEYQFLRAIKRFTKNLKFDLVLYSTPPVTLYKPLSFIKKRDKAISYLLLKDIFPQNVLDLGLLSKKNLIYKFFKHKEKSLYKISDWIGCMSTANVDYMKRNNPEIKNKLEINPNSIEPIKLMNKRDGKSFLFNFYKIPKNLTVFLFSGNIGKPQGMDNLLKILKLFKKNKKVFFLIIGDGTESVKVNKFIIKEKINNSLYKSSVNRKFFDKILAGCDVGLISLDFRFTFPNFPSRLLSYLENKMPVISITDNISDLGDILVKYNCGVKITKDNFSDSKKLIEPYINDKDLLYNHGNNGYNLLIKKFNVKESYKKIIDKI